MIYSGTIISESLHDESVLNFVEVKSREKKPLTGATDQQPKEIELISFTVKDEMVPAVADELSRLLKPGHWYADFGTEYDKYIVFAGKVFHYAPKEIEKQQKAKDYAKTLGIPEAQIDWK
jgi:hypothetical protein